MVATTSGGAAFVSVNRVANEYAAAKWTPLNYPGSTMTTGNTVYQDYALGIFFGQNGLSLENSYVADLKKVGLTRRGPPTCRQRREWLKCAEENSRRSRISSHLSLRAKSAGRGGPALPG
ncbi:MAG: hypothetical protein JHD00_13170, partial [Akkermansiaceae bacterium]|nr:hypothetical protein [Akkermansiaceae bacterium]